MVCKLNREFTLDVTDVARAESGGSCVTIRFNASSSRRRSTLTVLSRRRDA